MNKIIKLPYFHQRTDHTCGPACLKMIFAFFGLKLSEKKIVELTKTNFAGTNHAPIIKTARKEGFYCYVHDNSTINQIKHFIELDLPIIINYIEPSDNEGHYAIIVGYKKNSLVFDDPWNGRNFILPNKKFEKRWRDSKNKYKKWILVLSKNKFSIGKQYNPLK